MSLATDIYKNVNQNSAMEMYNQVINHLVTTALYAFVSGINLFAFVSSWLYNGVPSAYSYLNLVISVVFGVGSVMFARMVRTYARLSIELASNFDVRFPVKDESTK